MTIDPKYKPWLIGGGIILLLLVIVGIYFYRKGKKEVTIQDLPGDLPGSGDPNNNPAGISDAEILELSEKLHTDMKGINFFGHDNSLFQKLLVLSDTDFVKVYNTFNYDYQAEGKGTFTQWVADETNVTGNFATLKEAILDRCAKLNLD